MLGSSERRRNSRPTDPAVGVTQTPAVPGSRRVESPLPSLIDSTPVGKNAHWPIGDLSLRKTRFAMWRNGPRPTWQPGSPVTSPGSVRVPRATTHPYNRRASPSGGRDYAFGRSVRGGRRARRLFVLRAAIIHHGRSIGHSPPRAARPLYLRRVPTSADPTNGDGICDRRKVPG